MAADQAAIRERKHDLETALVAKPADTWQDLAIKLRYLIGPFADMAEALLKQLIASDDLARLAPGDVASPQRSDR